MTTHKRTDSPTSHRAATIGSHSSSAPRGAHRSLQATAHLDTDIEDIALEAIHHDADRRRHRHHAQLVRRAIEVVQIKNACNMDTAADLIHTRAADQGLPITEVAAAIVSPGPQGRTSVAVPGRPAPASP